MRRQSKSTWPDTCDGKPLMYAALGSQKNHMAVYLTGIYMDDGACEEFADSSRRIPNPVRLYSAAMSREKNGPP